MDCEINWNEKQWEENYNFVKQYSNENEGKIPIRTRNKERIIYQGIYIGTWCQSQRTNYRKKKLSKERFDKLQLIDGWFWEYDLDAIWEENYELLKEYVNLKKIIPKQACIYKEKNIGGWVDRQRFLYRNKKLNKKRIKKLESISNWFWEFAIDKKWNKNFELLKEYVIKEVRQKENKNKKRIYKNSYLPNGTVKYKNVSIGSWCNTLRMKKETLTKIQIKKLESIHGWFWDREEKWNKCYNLLKEYISLGNDLPHGNIIYKKYTIGRWCSTQRRFYDKLTDARKIKLELIKGWAWNKDILNKKDKIWDKHFELVKEYYSLGQPNGIIKRNTLGRQKEILIYKNIDIGSWCIKQRTDFNRKRPTCTEQHIQKLESIPTWTWGHLDYLWNETYKILKEYIKKNNKLPIQTEKYKTYNIGSWVGTQRSNYKNKKLTKEIIDKLESISLWSWNTIDTKWNNKYESLKQFVLKNKKIPSKRGTLQNWCTTQRNKYKNKNLNNEQIKNLECIPCWFWEINLDNIWNEKYKIFKEYIKTNKKLPTKKDIYKKIKLRNWYDDQQMNYKNNKLKKERIKKLESIPGWIWWNQKTITNKIITNKSKKKQQQIPNFENISLKNKTCSLRETRPEQRKLRDYLIAKKEHKCIICKNKKPLRYLIAAHLKPHNILIDEEKIDCNIVEFMCLECHASYDDGFIGINNGILKISKNAEEYYHTQYKNLINKRNNNYTDNNKKYFDYHYNEIFKK